MTTVAEAAFQHEVWRPRLDPLLPLAAVRLVQCSADPGAAFDRVVRRQQGDPARRAHSGPGGRDDYLRRLRAFTPLRLDAPTIEVDTTSGYRPALEEVIAFAAAVGG